MRQNEKKKLLLFFLVAYVPTFLMGIPMALLFQAGKDVGVFALAQMFYPAAGVMLGKLLFDRENKRLPRKFFYSFLVSAGVMCLWCFAGFLLPDAVTGPGTVLLSYVICVVVGCIYLSEDRVHKDTDRLTGKNWGLTVLMLALYMVMMFGPVVLGGALRGELGLLMEFVQPMQLLYSMLLSFLPMWVCFFGEEYGWRGYLQGHMQNKFGMRKGVLLLGVIWELWHLPLVFCYYAPLAPGNTLAELMVYRMAGVVLIAVFMAYAYLKTENLWAPVLIHFVNNHLASVFICAGGSFAEQGPSLVLLLRALLILPLLLTSVFKTKPERQEDNPL